VGRKKAERPTNANVAAKVLAEAKAERLWGSLIELECNRLGIDPETGVVVELSKKEKKQNADEGVISGPDYQGRFSIIPLTNVLRYLEDRAYGRPMENSTINHLHDKPLDVNMNLTLSERMLKALEKAEQRVSRRK
jgi:hypothetical protein